ncbi:hypothetical protein [Ktedonospora formicarum]|uniref:IPT/TIG domain-containing protein n=1 Tax=Ktedonospora formicarum TaxID=2778364 RepID=A0A8J3MRA9_9CHLR|nr:hypothetical protein [Ktedonospora formicarum]GHO43453.1 hypothetical protein KSX_16160 [Ktedonospora formicarum]
MFKVFLRRFTLLAVCGLFALSLAASLQPSMAHAAAPQVKISQPNVSGPILIGHPGTKVTLKGSGFKPNGTAKLYATPVGDPAKCKAGQVTADMKPFVPDSTTIQGDGSFTLDTNWPDAANNASIPYFVCVLTQDEQALSQNNFTVAQKVAIQVTPSSATPGDKITVRGTGWLPVQNLTVSIVSGGTPITSQATQSSGTDGTFSVTLAIPKDATEGTYQVIVSAPNEDTDQMKATQELTIAKEPPPVTTTPTTTTEGTPQVTPTPTTPNNSGGPSGLMIFTFLLGGIGIVLVIVGIIMYFSYNSRH